MSIHQLLQHPKTFLKSNAVWVSGKMNLIGKAKAEIWPVTLTGAGGVTCLGFDKKPIPCWEIVPAESMADFELAYFLPWGPNSTQSTTLGNKAKLFITDTMNGCSFAGETTGGAPKVAHVNYNVGRTEGNPIDQTFMDSEINRLFPPGTSGPKALRKADYLTPIFPNVTLIGVFRNNKWDFVYQVRDYQGATSKKNYALMSVHTVR